MTKSGNKGSENSDDEVVYRSEEDDVFSEGSSSQGDSDFVEAIEVDAPVHIDERVSNDFKDENSGNVDGNIQGHSRKRTSYGADLDLEPSLGESQGKKLAKRVASAENETLSEQQSTDHVSEEELNDAKNSTACDDSWMNDVLEKLRTKRSRTCDKITSVTLHDSIQRTLCNFMRRKSRPFSLIELNRENSHLTRLQITKSLQSLCGARLVQSKEGNKIFWFDQSIYLKPDAGYLDQIRNSIQSLKDIEVRGRASISKTCQEIQQLESEPADSEIEQEISRLRERLTEFSQACQNEKQKLENLNASKQEIHPIDYYLSEVRYYHKIWKARKIIATEFIGDMKENMGKKVKLTDLYEQIGVETDESFKTHPSSITF